MIRLAASPTNWGVDFADAPTNPPWGEILDQIAVARTLRKRWRRFKAMPVFWGR